MAQFTFIDLFSGIGGFRMGLEACGGKCVFSCEKDKYAINTYKANFDCSDHIIHNDITKLDGSEIPSYDVLCAGFPCQSFSIAIQGRKDIPNGLNVKGKGTLFFELARIIKETQPKCFILENVKNLLRHDGGNTFKVIRNILENELGYNIQYRVINSKHFVPQARERIFIVGFKEKNSFDFNKLELPNKEYKLKDILETNIINDTYTLSDRRWSTLQRRKEKYQRLYGNDGFSYKIADINKPAKTLCAKYQGNGDILIYQNNKNPRKLTPVECSRVMGFNFNLSKEFIIPVSKSQAYKQFGNAVVPQVVEWVGSEIRRFI